MQAPVRVKHTQLSDPDVLSLNVHAVYALRPWAAHAAGSTAALVVGRACIKIGHLKVFHEDRMSTFTMGVVINHVVTIYAILIDRRCNHMRPLGAACTEGRGVGNTTEPTNDVTISFRPSIICMVLTWLEVEILYEHVCVDTVGRQGSARHCHRWAISPQNIEQFRIFRSIFKVSAPTIQHDCSSMLSMQTFQRLLWTGEQPRSLCG